jgi:hypothetical protein
MIRRIATALAVSAAVLFFASCSSSTKDTPSAKPGAPDPT